MDSGLPFRPRLLMLPLPEHSHLESAGEMDQVYPKVTANPQHFLMVTWGGCEHHLLSFRQLRAGAWMCGSNFWLQSHGFFRAAGGNAVTMSATRSDCSSPSALLIQILLSTQSEVGLRGTATAVSRELRPGWG